MGSFVLTTPQKTLFPGLKRLRDFIEAANLTLNAAVAGLMYAWLDAAQFSLTIVSLMTTYAGFLVVLSEQWLAILAAFGLQSLVFWLPRHLRTSRSFVRTLFECFAFAFSLMISILFSYQAFVELLVPKEVREYRDAARVLMEAQPLATQAKAAIDGAVSLAEAKAKEKSERANREYDVGGTQTATRKGIGPVYNQLKNESEHWSARADTLKGVQRQAADSYSVIMTLPSDGSLEPKTKRRLVSDSLGTLVSLAQNTLVQEVLEEAGGQEMLKKIQTLRLPEMSDSARLSEAVMVRDRFTNGILLAHDAIRDVWKMRDNREIGALEALFLAAVVDLLIVILGFMRAGHTMPASTTKFASAVANLGTLVRCQGGVGVLIDRSEEGEGKNVDRVQELALQGLIDRKLIKVVQLGNGQEVHIFHENLIEEMSQLV